ncbi:hypothetical protein AB0M43_38350 [Longispora sp. NPDC051575]|uniref:hypothetical protein n=1 Tax=Longispora sp. NPDC051575 TaxID=3154943 RepID=UPI00343D6BAE
MRILPHLMQAGDTVLHPITSAREQLIRTGATAPSVALVVATSSEVLALAGVTGYAVAMDWPAVGQVVLLAGEVLLAVHLARVVVLRLAGSSVAEAVEALTGAPVEIVESSVPADHMEVIAPARTGAPVTSVSAGDELTALARVAGVLVGSAS